MQPITQGIGVAWDKPLVTLGEGIKAVTGVDINQIVRDIKGGTYQVSGDGTKITAQTQKPSPVFALVALVALIFWVN